MAGFNGVTPLHRAVLRIETDVLYFLLEKGMKFWNHLFQLKFILWYFLAKLHERLQTDLVICTTWIRNNIWLSYFDLYHAENFIF